MKPFQQKVSDSHSLLDGPEELSNSQENMQKSTPREAGRVGRDSGLHGLSKLGRPQHWEKVPLGGTQSTVARVRLQPVLLS